MRVPLIILVALAFLGATCKGPSEVVRERKVLVFSKTAGFRHESIEAGIAAIQRLGRERGFSVIATEDEQMFREEVLKSISAIVFLNTTGDVLGPEQKACMERFIQAGGGFVGVHSATDTEYNWPWYGQLVGAYFNGHPHIQPARLLVQDRQHPATAKLPEVWERTDEWYNFRDIRPEIQALILIDEDSYTGGTNGDFHPVAWHQEYDGGRAFYTALGHTLESYEEPRFLEHLAGGIEYAIGSNPLDFGQCRTELIPEDTRFGRAILDNNLDEPMELDILPDGKVMFIERKGLIKLYHPRLEMTTIAGFIPVHSEHEDGLIGLAIDPGFRDNGWVYLFYSPPGPRAVQRVSRFIFRHDSLHLASEQVLLEIPVQREECCHAGGGLEFGPDGLLYIGVGDNTNPFASEGYAPIDERPGRAAWDAQSSSANTNDLRGKILRIRPLPEGGYAIPAGNLFPSGTPGTRPEIYVMGCRNPFRFSIDSKRNWLFWGDVGPDAGKSDSLRGPKGLDEINLAKSAGFWGWPYTRGNNQPYRDYDFAARRSGPPFDPQNLYNDSPNNTGLRRLPPAQPSLIWYSYDESEEFPWMGVGGKNPMAGPVYYSDQYDGPHQFPPYFDGKLIVYEWMRHWLYVVSLDSMGRFLQADPFLPLEPFSRPMDLAFAPDGTLYMLEYGNTWYARNEDARLSRISYLPGNRPPLARMKLSATAGAAPLAVQLSAQPSVDYDGDRLSYRWFVEGKELPETAANIAHVFQLPGVYRVRLEVRDGAGATAFAEELVAVGNAPPQVRLAVEGNRSFFWDGRKLPYRVEVEDAEDGRLGEPGFPAANVSLQFDYLPEGLDFVIAAAGHAAGMAGAALSRGARLMEQSDCSNCHALGHQVNGPSYLEMARRYASDPLAPRRLALKIIQGGGGNWGQAVMSAHPLLSEEQALEMTAYILSLGQQSSSRKPAFPLAGTFAADRHRPGNNQGLYWLSAAYTDTGNGAMPALSARDELYLRPLSFPVARADKLAAGLRVFEDTKEELVGAFRHGRYFMLKDIDLSGLSHVELHLFLGPEAAGGTLSLRAGKPDGPLLAETAIAPVSRGFGTARLDLAGRAGPPQDLYFVFENPAQRRRPIADAARIEFFPEVLP